MTSAQRGGDKKYPKFADKQYIEFKRMGGRGVKKSENFADIMYMEPPQWSCVFYCLGRQFLKEKHVFIELNRQLV